MDDAMLGVEPSRGHEGLDDLDMSEKQPETRTEENLDLVSGA